VHVLDASLAVNVVRQLLSSERKLGFVEKVRQQQEQSREAYEGRKTKKALLSLVEARKRRAVIDWPSSDIPKPGFLGTRVMSDLPLDNLVSVIDWTPFFHTWELKGRYPKIFEDQKVGSKAKELFHDAQQLLQEIVEKKLLTAKAVYGFSPANSMDEDICIFLDDSRTHVVATIHTLRQQMEKPPGEGNYALADFIAPQASGLADYIGGFAVTTGIGIEALCERFEKDHDDYNSIMAKALADRLAEAFAEWLHREVRREWGYGVGENLSHEDLIRERYRGIRPAPGYPACPDHTEKQILFDLLSVETTTGIRLTENYAMYPASSVSGLYFSHPQAKYFSVGKMDRDQIQDYAIRKKMDLATVERWLSPNLHYDPGASPS
jgi:5-methyltetrahydrofolate--homocysteine methyltransferase